MKIWSYRLKSKDDEMGEAYEDLKTKYPLYAITPKKEIAKTFEATRNMDLFIKIVDEYDGDDSDMFLAKHRGSILSETVLESYKDKNTDHQDTCFAKVVLTENELNFVLEMIESSAVLNKVSYYLPVDIFEKDIKDALRYLQYEHAGNFVSSMRMTEMEMDGAPIDESFYMLTLEYDMFGVFMLYYGHTFSSGFFEHVEMFDAPPDDGVASMY